jgi:Ca2+-binding EF-hand superfamily protein
MTSDTKDIEVLREAFRKIDTESTSYITVLELK